MSEASVTAALVVIGNEILSGRTKDANVTYLARQLTALGIVLAEVRMVRDEERAIIAAVDALRATHDYVFTTGGIGPTHDDITCEAVAKAFGRAYRLNPEARCILEEYYDGSGRALNEARMRMAYTPEGAALIDNPVSRAPGFRVENVYVLAGIPAVMRGMFESVVPTLKGGIAVKSREIAVLLGEGDVAARLGALQERYPALEIGSYPFVRDGAFGTTLVLRGTDEDQIASAGESSASSCASLAASPNCSRARQAEGERLPAALAPYFDKGIRKVVVSAPGKDAEALNIVVGVNDNLYDPERHHLVTAASCTTNCLAPVVKVLHEGLGIVHGSITTVHDVTNTQVIVDALKTDLRRARSAVIDAPCTMVVNGSQVKVYAWYDSEWGYVNRMMELAARIARDVWFVVGVPVYLYSEFGWSFDQVGAFMAAWIVGYGLVQALVPRLLKATDGTETGVANAKLWGILLIFLPAALAVAMTPGVLGEGVVSYVLVGGLLAFGVVFAFNSSVHSFLIVAYSDSDKVALNVGFYHMANAAGRLGGTLLSGLLFQLAGLEGTLWASTVLVALAVAFTLPLPSARGATLRSSRSPRP